MITKTSISIGSSTWLIQLDLPHDWAIEGDFSPANPSGAGGGALPGGIGWYRKHLQIDNIGDDAFFIEFDGVYMNSTVYVNGQKVGYRPYGYSSFEYDITRYLKRGDNVIAVRVDNSDQPNSRWYSGSGIYRPVRLVVQDANHIEREGVRVTTLALSPALIRVETSFVGEGTPWVRIERDGAGICRLFK